MIPGDGLGRIGITLCPGNNDPHGCVRHWDRDQEVYPS